MPSLYEINEKYMNLFSQVDEYGEIQFDEKELDENSKEFEQKADNIACFIKNELAFVESVKKEIEMLQERKKVHENKIESLNKYLLRGMETRGRDKLETVRNKISTRKSTIVNVIDENLIPKKFIEKKVNTRIMKKEIKEALNDGKKVKGAELKENKSLNIK